MSSPVSPFRRSSIPTFLHHDEHPAHLLAPPRSGHGHGIFSSLLLNRSAVSLQSVHGRDEEDHLGVAGGHDSEDEHRRSAEDRRLSAILNGPHMRSMRLIGNSNPRYKWERYWRTEEQLHEMSGKVRRYYERTNYLIQQYLYIDHLLDSSLPHDLLNEYSGMAHSTVMRAVDVPDTIREEPSELATSSRSRSESGTLLPGREASDPALPPVRKVKRTPKDIYRPSETTPLFQGRRSMDEDDDQHGENGQRGERKPDIPWLEDDEVDSDSSVVTMAIYVNMAANMILLAGKSAVVISVPSISVLASLVDAVLDFLSTAIVWTTTWLIRQQDQYKYPVGRRRLEPIGVLVFSIIMIMSFVQVSLEAIQRLASKDHTIIALGLPAITIMLSTVVIKGLCWLWCRFIKNSGVQALAADAFTDVIFNTGSMAFPILGFYANIWWLDALGGLLLSIVVINNWSQTSTEHIKNLCGASATADQRNVLLYLTMRFARTIKKIQGLQAYHAGDKLNVEVDIVLDEHTSLKDSHDLSESLQYMLESVPIVDRAFVHVDYASYNLPTHMEQQAR